MQELPERQFGITTEECKAEAIKWMMSYSAESLNPSLWYRRIVFRRVYLGQAIKRRDAIRTLQYHYNQRWLLGSRLQRDEHMCFSPICFFTATPPFNILSHGAAKQFLIMLKQTLSGSIFGLSVAKCIDGLWKCSERMPKSAFSFTNTHTHTHLNDQTLTVVHVIYKFPNYR